MEVIRGQEGDCGQEIRGGAERRGARSAGGHGSRGQELGADPDESAHPPEGRRFGGGRRVERQRHLGALNTSINNVARTRQQLVEEGFEATLKRKYNPNSARPRIFDGAAEAKLIALACSPAPEGFARWSLRLLEEKVVELDIVDKASDNTIGRTLKKRAQAAPQSAMGDPARSQRGLRRRHGRRAGNLPKAARSRSSSRVCGRNLQAIDRRDARADPRQARPTGPPRLRI